MAQISLRSYLREIESLTDSGQVDEAIAHCKHILKTYPKSIDVYRQLGKAFLENQRYSDAADILQRVLSAIPDDFISHIGMSIIREDEGNLDEALWHMERAFEVQPSNSAIQEELRRLYSRRDGFEPPKIRMTRGALARLYARGDLHQQAIAEMRAALLESPQRIDLLPLLARQYLEIGQRAEAAETCNTILRRLPYCLEANRILVEILSDSERAEDAATYRRRVQSLDPYSAFLRDPKLTSESVPEQAISIEKMDWHAEQAVSADSGKPAWAASLGIDIGDFATGSEKIPEWLASPTADSSVPPSSPVVQPFSSVSSQDQIPDWMKEAGWIPSTGEGEQAEAATALAHQSPFEEGDIAKAEIPDWLQGMAPAQEETPSPVLSSAEPAPAKPVVETPDWLKEFGAVPIEPEPAAAAEIPDWLQGLAPVQEETPSPAVSAAEPTPAEPVAEIPVWLQGLAPVQEETPAPVVPTVEPTPAEAFLEEPVQAAEPDESIEIPLGDEAAFAWLENLAARQGADEGMLLHEEERLAAPPQWVQEVAPQEIEPAVVGTPEPVEEPVEQISLPGEPELAAEAPIGDEAAFAWLEGLAARQGADEGLLLGEEERLAAPPQWVQEVEIPPAEPEPITEPAQAAPTTPDWLQALAAENEMELTPTVAEEAPVAAEEALTAALMTEEIPPVAEITTEAEVQTLEPEVIPETAPELPEWLAAVEVEPEIGEEPWKPSKPKMPAEPVHFVNINQASLAELERLPGIGFILAQHIIAHREANGPFDSVENLLQVPGITEDNLLDIQDVLTFETLEEPEIVAPVDQTSAELLKARNALVMGQMDESIAEYTALIKARLYLPEILNDLQEALHRFPKDAAIWQALGDAYVRTDQIQQALDAYTKAEELIR